MSRRRRPDADVHGVLVVDKPAGPTSHDVVGRVRRLAGTRKVGHAGTLDPAATGVLVLGLGRATRLLGPLAAGTKAYTATVRLGGATTTDDAAGEPLGGAPADGLDETVVRDAVARLTGDLRQVPSSFSAVKVDGVRAHALARAGEDVALAARPVHVARFAVDAVRRQPPWLDLDVAVVCSAGTYVRALARDLGEALGVGGHLTALRRTAAGPFGLDDAVDLARLEPDAGEGGVAPRLLPVADAVARALPRLDLDDDEARRLALGQRLAAPPDSRLAADDRVVPPTAALLGAFAPDGTVVALVEVRDGAVRPRVVLAPQEGPGPAA